ncbi:MAG: bifunctional DNA-formamidopyrimidine glycosylase/DNA-(apurinic or apyrimidinic site) lyase [Armatimonadota bacterium]
MPELPEVETMRRDLARAVGKATITHVEVLDEKIIVGSAEAFIKGLTGRRVTAFGRRGKVLIIDLDNGTALLGHPRMTGRFFALKSKEELTRFARVVIHLDNAVRVVFDDIRRFGRLEVVASSMQDEAALLRNIGHDALHCDLGHLSKCFGNRSIPIKTALLDQKVVAGIGNIYASEILHRCGIDPRTPSKCLKPKEMAAIARETELVLAEGVEHRGTTISDYRTMDGKKGNFQDRLRVYGREGAPCLRNGCEGTIQKISLGGRSTYFCSHCQRTGRRRRLPSS